MSGETITVNGDSLDWAAGMTVSDVLASKKYTFRMLVVRVDGQLVKKDQWVNDCGPRRF